MFDKTEKLRCGSLIQHGPFNDRIYLLEAGESELHSLPVRLMDIAAENTYGKIVAKLDEKKALPFLNEGFVVEAKIPAMYSGEGDGFFIARYLDKSRKEEEKISLYEKNLKLAHDKQGEGFDMLDTDKFSIRQCTQEDVPAMEDVYREVFKTYPFPIHKTSYLEKTMSENVDYYCVEHDDKIIALSSAEKDKKNKYAEMTDFATLPEWRGNGLALHLLKEMEASMKRQGIGTLFTIARSASPGMNITFAKAGYEYGGRLKNNTNISGQIESMNIWYKKLKIKSA